MTLRELNLHQRAHRLRYKLCQAQGATGYVLESTVWGSINCADIDALEQCVNDLPALKQARLNTFCAHA